jgi:hypothetical protein
VAAAFEKGNPERHVATIHGVKITHPKAEQAFDLTIGGSDFLLSR